MFLPANAAASADWQQVGFDNKTVTLVQANPLRPQEVAVVANNQLNLTRTGGLLWEVSSVPVVARSIAYDPLDIDTIFAGTDRGLYVSYNFGRTWQLFESQLTPNKFVIKVVATNQHIFAVTGSGSSFQNKIHRFTRTGTANDTLYPDTNALTVTYDSNSRQVYAGSRKGVYVSSDEGVNWRILGGGMGQLTYEVVIKNDIIWQSSSDGLYRSSNRGTTWQLLAKTGAINNTNYGSSMLMRGLVINNGVAYYGSYSTLYDYKFLVKYDGGDGFGAGLDEKVDAISGANNLLWAGTQDGLWLNRNLIASEAEILRPVIIIPGILASMPVPLGHAAKYSDWVVPYAGQKYKTNMVADPINGTYDPLLENLEAKGYQMNKTLFTFPYQWRQDNHISARQLADKIDDVQKICSCSKVDLVGHSMGGLVARAYVQSDYYGEDVRNLIQIGTPNAGSVNAYAQWESGEIKINNFQDQLKKKIFQIEALYRGHITLVQHIRQEIVAAGQLLPIFNYIDGRIYPGGYPRNIFLENLNKPDNIQRLNQRVSFYAIGSKNHQTLKLLKTQAEDDTKEYWPHGKIINQSTGDGDGTVLASSLSAISPISSYLPGDHSGIVFDADLFIAQTIMAGYVLPVENEIKPFKKFLLAYVKSPVKISVTDPQGKKLNDAINSIPGGYYTGSGEHPQMAIIPFYQDGVYDIELEGTGSGAYGVGIVEFNEATNETIEKEKAGNTIPGQISRYQYNTDKDTFDIIENSPANTIEEDSVGDVLVSNNKSGTDPVQKVAILSDNSDAALVNKQDTLVVSSNPNNNNLRTSSLEVEGDKTIMSNNRIMWSILTAIVSTAILLMLWKRRKEKINF